MMEDDESWLREVAKTSTVALPEDLSGVRVGRYVVERLIGHGGMGAVYRAHDAQLDRVVALKVLPARWFTDDTRRRRFLREARIVAKLDDPSIATMFDAGEDSERVFLAMEYVDGRTLRDVLRSDAHLDVAAAIRTARAIAGALARAHAAGVVHRDIKPDNVMLATNGAVKVLDFGVARLERDDEGGTLETRAGTLVGTPSYMSPEQAKGERVDARSDVFSFGVVLYEMISGARPFQGKTPLDVLIAIDRDDPLPLARARRDVPAWLAALVMRCLEKDATRRPADGAALVAALERGAVTKRSMRPVLFAGVLGIAATALVFAARSGAGSDAPRAPPEAASKEAAPAPPPPPVAASASSIPEVLPSTSASAAPPSIVPKPRPKLTPAKPGPLDDPK